MLNILAAILLFGLIVLVHESVIFCGKAKRHWRSGIFLGMGPRLASFVHGETRYSLKALPSAAPV